MSPVEFAARIAAKAHHRATSRLVTYRRGSLEISLRVTAAETRGETESAEGVQLGCDVQSELILVESLDFGTGPVRPQVGDQIIEEERVATVMGTGNRKAWEWETTGVRYLVHTQEQ